MKSADHRLTAETILRHARGNGIYAHQSPELIALLMNVDLDQRIPQPLYQCAAALLVWLHGIDSAGADMPEQAAPAIAPPAL